MRLAFVQSDALRGGPSVVVTTTSGETMMENKLLVAVAGYLELYDFTNHSYTNRKQQAWRQMSTHYEEAMATLLGNACIREILNSLLDL